MYHRFLCCTFAVCMAFLTLCPAKGHAQKKFDPRKYPAEISYTDADKFHVQGVVVNTEKKYVCFSFTTHLVKTDLEGNVLGTVEGITGHLGDLALNPDNGLIYGSLEYKNDAIGKGIRHGLDMKEETKQPQTAFYIAIFNPDKITRVGMDACRDRVMTTVYLPTVVEDYEANVTLKEGRTVAHRYGCSGIDGVTFAPDLKQQKHNLLYVAYGIYADTTRTDNDYQVLLAYDTDQWKRYEQPLYEENPHVKGPAEPLNRYFVYTGNTNYGIQNMAFDSSTNRFFMAAYKGIKKQFPNFTLFATTPQPVPVASVLKGFAGNTEGAVIPLSAEGEKNSTGDIRGWHFKYGATGLAPVGEGYFYISHPAQDPVSKQQSCTLKLYRWTGDEEHPFKPYISQQ